MFNIKNYVFRKNPFFFDDLAIYGVLIMIISGKRGGAVGAR